MILADAVTALKGGSGFTNPIPPLTTTLVADANDLKTTINGKVVGGVPTANETSIINYADSIITLCNKAITAVNNLITPMKVQLPVLKAVDGIYAKLNPAQGSNPSQAFTDAFSPVDVSTTRINAVRASLTPALLVELKAETVTNLPALVTAVSAADTAITNAITASTAAIADANNTLSSFAYASFTAGAQPAHVSAVMDKFGSVKVTG